MGRASGGAYAPRPSRAAWALRPAWETEPTRPPETMPRRLVLGREEAKVFVLGEVLTRLEILGFFVAATGVWLGTRPVRPT